MEFSSRRSWSRQRSGASRGATSRVRSRRLRTVDGVPRCWHVERLENRVLLSFAQANSPIEVDGTQANPIVSDSAEVVSTHRTTAEDANGEILDVWEQSSDDIQLGITARSFSTSGAPQGDPFHVPGTTAYDTQATVAMNAAGDSVIAWTHSSNGSGPTTVELQYFQGTTPQGSAIVIPSAFSGGSTSGPSVAYENSEVVVAYTDSNASGTSNQVKALEIQSGTQTHPTVAASTATTQASVAMDASGNFVIAWTQGASAFDQVATGYVIAERFTSGGSPQGSDFTVGSSQIENEPSAAMTASGDFVVAYTDFVSSQVVNEGGLASHVIVNRTDVDAILYNAQGGVLQTIDVWASSDPSQNGYDPSAAMNSTGGFVVGYTTGGNFGVDDPDEPGPTSVECSAYNNSGGSTQAPFNLAQNMPVFSNPSVGAPPQASFILPSVALSPSGVLASEWEAPEAKVVGEQEYPGVFTAAFVDSNFTFTLPQGNTIDITGGVPDTIPIVITRNTGETATMTVSFSALPAGAFDSVSGDIPISPDLRAVTFNSLDGTKAQQVPAVLNVSDGQVTLSTDVLFLFTPSVITSLDADFGFSPPPATDTVIPGQEATIYGSGFVDVSGVQFGTGGPKSTDVSTSADGTSLTVLVPGSSNTAPSLSGPITIMRNGADGIVSSFNPSYSEGFITGLTDNVTPEGEGPLSTTVQGFAAGYDTNVSKGTQLIIKGLGFEQGDLVLFGPQLALPPPSQLFNPNQPVFYESSSNFNLPYDINTGPVILTSSSSAAQWLAAAKIYGTAPTYVDPGGTYMDVDVPEDAVSGYVYVVHPDGAMLQSQYTFQVFSFRNSFGFSILNGPDGTEPDSTANPSGQNNELNGQDTVPDSWDDFVLTQADLEEEFPGALTNVVNYLTSEAQLGAWEAALNNNGTCFGLDVTASLLYQAEFDGGYTDPTQILPLTGAGAPPGINFSNPAYAPVFSLAWSSDVTMNGLTLPLVKMLQLNLISQMSVFATTTTIDQIAEFQSASGASVVPDFINPIASELAAGRPPIISILPAGHSILAYNIEPDGQGGYYVDCYNPNDPVDSSYITGGTSPGTNPMTGLNSAYLSPDDTSGKPGYAGQTYPVETQAGMLIEDNTDRIHITANGDWIWMQADGQLFAGYLGGGALQVIPVNINAVNHNTPFVGPAGTMSLPNPGNDVYLDGLLIVLPAAAGAGVGLGAIAVGAGWDFVTEVLPFLDGTTPSRPPASGGGANVAPAAGVPLVKDLATHGSHHGRTWWVGSAAGSSFPDIQSAIDSPSVRNGDTIEVEPGTYADAPLAGDTVLVDKSLTIIGGQSYPNANQHGASIVTGDGVGFTLAADDIAIEGFTIRPATLPQGTAGIATAAGFSGSGYQIRDNILEDEASGLLLNTQGGKSKVAQVVRASIRTPRGPHALIRRQTNRGDVAPAIRLFGSSPNSSVRTLASDPIVLVRDAKGSRGRGSSTSSTVAGNTFADNTTGISSDVGMNSITISANTFNGDTSASIAVTGSSESSDVQILDNQVTSDAAIVLQNVTNSKVESNHIVNPYHGAGDAVWLDGGVTRTVVQQNALVGAAGAGNGVDSSGAGNASDTISRNTVADFAKGIRLNAAGGDTVLDNTVQQCTTAGIDLANGATNNKVKGNTADQDYIGVVILGANSNTILDNKTAGNQTAGIEVLGCNGNAISHNNASSNAGAVGILVSGSSNEVSNNAANGNSVGIGSLLSTGTTISHNTANANTLSGIEVQYDVNASGQKDEVVQNTAAGNGDGGILLYLSTYVTVSRDRADDNTGFGIEAQNSGEADTFDTISRNTADGNSGGAGISLVNDDATSVSGNTTKSNGVAGIGTQDSNNDSITGNKT
jgi:parallel beta-helix repeat protein